MGPPFDENATPVGVTSASGCKCGCDSEFVMYVSSMRDASVTEMGVEDTLWLGGGASSDILRVCSGMQKVGEGEEVAMVVELVTF
jgi:hypothetical protein